MKPTHHHDDYYILPGLLHTPSRERISGICGKTISNRTWTWQYLKAAMPLLKKGAKTIGREALKTGLNIAGDVVSNRQQNHD